MPELDHVALAVRDPAVSLGFYRDMVGIEGTVREEEYGYVIKSGRVSFTLFRGEPPENVGEFHVGTNLPDALAVRQTRERLQSVGVVETEWWDEPGYVSLKVTDPDGYIVEIAWDEKH